jgi:hypothetical protein
MSILAALLIAGFARLATGRRIADRPAPSLLRLLSVLYTLQLAIFIAQETLEGGSPSGLFLWGLAGQLPMALAGAVALRWLSARVEPALARLRLSPSPAIRLAAVSIVTVSPAPVPAAIPSTDFAVGAFSRRGPPVST